MHGIIVEFYGIPRERAGRTELIVAAGPLGDVLAAVQRHCPRLQDVRQPTGNLNPNYRISLDGQRFLTDIAEIVPAQSRLLLLSADPGG
jgi:molybdopterin converting factor small subunit